MGMAFALHCAALLCFRLFSYLNDRVATFCAKLLLPLRGIFATALVGADELLANDMVKDRAIRAEINELWARIRRAPLQDLFPGFKPPKSKLVSGVVSLPCLIM
jgi:hypothetical protein